MSTHYNFKPILHKRQWDLCSVPGVISAAGTSGVKSRLHDQRYYVLRGGGSVEVYNPYQDAWALLPVSGINTVAGGACAEFMPMGPSGTATAGSTTTLTTNLTLPTDLRGYKIRITGGPGAGDERTILSNTLGANSVITVSPDFSTTITSSSTYTLVTGRLYLISGGTLTGSGFRVYDFATNTYSTLSVTGLPASFGSDGALVGSPSIPDLGEVNAYATGTATAGGASTLTNAAKTWTVNQWANAYQIRITAGTGTGQVRRIASNTATVITTTAAWTTNPDATSAYSIEGDDDSLYLFGNAAITAYRYSISGNSWTTLSPGVARSGIYLAGGSCARLIDRVDDPAWSNESAIINGRCIYSFRSSGVLDYYDIALNTWVNSVSYGPCSFTPAAGFKYADYNGVIYIRDQSTAFQTGRIFSYNCTTNQLLPWGQATLLSTSGIVGNTPFVVVFGDGSTKVAFLYLFVEHSTLPALVRCQIG